MAVKSESGSEKKPKMLMKGKILKCEYLSDWLNPINKKKLYIHEIVVDDGGKGKVFVVEKNSPRISVGTYIEYEYDFTTDRIKIHSSSIDPNPTISKTGEKLEVKSKLPPSARKDTYIGYAWSYAKDLVIAGKTMKDMEELDKMATYIYERIGKQLKGE